MVACVKVCGNEPLSMDSLNTDKSSGANLPINVLKICLETHQGLGPC